MRLTLRGRVLALVFLANAVVFGMGGLFVVRTQFSLTKRLEDEVTEDLLATIEKTIRPDGLSVPPILSWPFWYYFEDAILVDRALVRTASGVDPTGVHLNPLGVGNRLVSFDEQDALAAIERAIRLGPPNEAIDGGRIVLIDGPSGGIWGGIWVRSRDRFDEAALLRTMLPWFALSTLVLTLGTFFAMRRLLLDPIAALARGAQRVRSGDLSVRLPVSTRRDELADLVRLFNEMTSTVQGFNDRLEEEVRIATAQARQAEAAAMTQRRLAAMGELAAGIAHEINNPLGGLLNAVTTLGRDDLSDEKRDRYLRLLSTGLTRIGETVNRLRRFTPRETTREELDLADVVCDAVDLVRHRAERLRVEINLFGIDSERPTISGARNEIGQAVLNLLVNSLDALEDRAAYPESATYKPRIDLALRADEHGIALTVFDNGPGVNADELERVRDLFYTTKDVGRGTGLGLSLVHSTLQQHGGRMTVSSEAGRSFRVELWFPTGAANPEGEPATEATE